MPELPEVETVKRGLETALQNNSFDHIKIYRRDLRIPIPANLEQRLNKQAIKNIIRRGKYIVVFTQTGEGFVLHLGMSGRIRIYQDKLTAEAQARHKHDHVIFDMQNQQRVVFNDPRRFGMLYSVDEQNWEQQKPFSDMGIEPLGNHFNPAYLANALSSKKSPIKSALLDQSVIAGIGNIYACEALYYAGIDPRRSAHRLNENETAKLCTAIREVLIKAIEAGGSSLRDHVQTDGSLGYFQTQWAVYGRQHEKCPACHDNCRIQRITQSGRSTFYCPTQQQ